jgi:cobalt-zinc-cadmium efflux system outer membrane protein
MARWQSHFLGVLLAALVAVAGCKCCPTACGEGDVSAGLGERTGLTLGPFACPNEIVLPHGATLADGVAEEEAVLIALWNNALFHEQLTQIGIARGDLIQAGLLPNPELVFLFPATDKPYRYAIDFPLEALWLRPIRVAAAERESVRVCAQLTQLGINLIRDVRQAYADLLLARGNLAVAEEAVRIRSEISRLAAARLEAGDVSVQEAAITRIDAHIARQDVARLGYSVSIAEERLRNLLGLGLDRTPLVPVEVPPPRMVVEIPMLVNEAIGTRPDMLAAEENVAAANERLRLVQRDWFRFFGILDATSGTNTGHEFSPGLRLTLPIFHWNGGTIARAEAVLEQALRQRQTIHDQIIMEVHQSHARYVQAASELAIVEHQVRAEVEASIRRTESAYREGNTSYLLVLESTRQLLDNRLRQAQLTAELRRAWADLERSVGRRLTEASLVGTIEPLPEARLAPPADSPNPPGPVP